VCCHCLCNCVIINNLVSCHVLDSSPGQKLKVQIPAKADMEKRTFVASVPGPKVPFTKKENNLPKEFKEALCKCSAVVAEASVL